MLISRSVTSKTFKEITQKLFFLPTLWLKITRVANTNRIIFDHQQQFSKILSNHVWYKSFTFQNVSDKRFKESQIKPPISALYFRRIFFFNTNLPLILRANQYPELKKPLLSASSLSTPKRIGCLDFLKVPTSSWFNKMVLHCIPIYSKKYSALSILL